MSLLRMSDLNTGPRHPRAAQESEARKQGLDAQRWGFGAVLDRKSRQALTGVKGKVLRVNADISAPPRVTFPAGNFLGAALFAAILIGSAPVSRAEPSPMRVESGSGFWELAFTPNIVAIAKRDLGKSGPQIGLPSRLWCGDALNRWRRKAGLTVVPSRRAIDQAAYGKRLSRPVPGALLITSRGRGAHVDVIVAVHGDGTVTTIGGNVSNRVAERRRAARGIIIKPV